MIFLFLVSDVFTEFYAGRIKPGKFEYPKMNGWMLVEEAKTKCENDLACGGFTFKGSYKTLNRLMEIYFFHIIPSNKDDNYFYWSTYKVNRNFVKLPNRTVKYGKIYSQNYTGNYLDMKKLTNMGIVAIQPLLGLGYTKIDFSDFIPSNNSEDGIILNLKLSNMIDHTFPKVDRCCKTIGKNIDYDGIDNIKRIDCNISRKNFTNTYVNRREPIMVKGCQTEWKASNWTIENLLDRYEFWPTFHQNDVNSTWSGKTLLKSNKIKNLIESGHFVKIFPKLNKNIKGWTRNKETEVKLMLDLIDEYSVPYSMPEDEFYKYHVDTDQAYIGFATAETGTYSTYYILTQLNIFKSLTLFSGLKIGTKMHVDTVLADAFNALIRGEKWWVVLPKDLYEFRDEYSCDPKCSEPFDNFQRITGVWFTHILPQIRYA